MKVSFTFDTVTLPILPCKSFKWKQLLCQLICFLYVFHSSTPRELETCERRASQIRSVRFEFDESPASDLSSGSYRSESSQYGSPGKGNNYQLSGRGHSPYPTPLILSNEMQTPGTVYVSAKMQGCAVAGKITKVRSQYVYPVEEFTQWNALKET